MKKRMMNQMGSLATASSGIAWTMGIQMRTPVVQLDYVASERANLSRRSSPFSMFARLVA